MDFDYILLKNDVCVEPHELQGKNTFYMEGQVSCIKFAFGKGKSIIWDNTE